MARMGLTAHKHTGGGASENSKFILYHIISNYLPVNVSNAFHLIVMASMWVDYKYVSLHIFLYLLQGDR